MLDCMAAAFSSHHQLERRRPGCEGQILDYDCIMPYGSKRCNVVACESQARSPTPHHSGERAFMQGRDSHHLNSAATRACPDVHALHITSHNSQAICRVPRIRTTPKNLPYRPPASAYVQPQKSRSQVAAAHGSSEHQVAWEAMLRLGRLSTAR